MKLTTSTLIVLAAITPTEAGWTYPARGWSAISNTLPGATFRKREALPEPVAALDGGDLEARGGSSGNYYSACGYKNMASKYYSYPINGYAYAAAVVQAFPVPSGTSSGASGAGAGAGSTNNGGGTGNNGAGAGAGSAGTNGGSGAGAGSGSGPAGSGGSADTGASASAGGAAITSPVQQRFVLASSAYDCCAQAMQDPNSLFFFYTSNSAGFYTGANGAAGSSSDNDASSSGAATSAGGSGTGPQCIIASNSYCPIPNSEAVVLAASYNATAPRGTSYGNYLGNGRCGSGVRFAFNNANAAICAANSAGVQQSNPNQQAAANGAAAACAYTSPTVTDSGGANPVGDGSSTG